MFGTGLGVLLAALVGNASYDLPALIAGIGAGFYGISRGLHRIAEGYLKYQEGKSIAKGLTKEYCDTMRSLVCFGAETCPERKLEPDKE